MDGYGDPNARWLGYRTADIVLRKRDGAWKIEEIYFRSLRQEQKPSRLSDILDSLTAEITPKAGSGR